MCNAHNYYNFLGLLNIERLCFFFSQHSMLNFTLLFCEIFFIHRVEQSTSLISQWNIYLFSFVMFNKKLKSTNSSVYEHVHRHQTTKFSDYKFKWFHSINNNDCVVYGYGQFSVPTFLSWWNLQGRTILRDSWLICRAAHFSVTCKLTN